MRPLLLTELQGKIATSMEEIKVVIVPFPAQGHLNQLLHFSLRLSSYGLSVHFASSSTHNRQGRTRLQGWSSKSLDNIQFHNLQLPPIPASPPDPNSSIKFPNHLIPDYYEFMNLNSPLCSLLRSLSTTCRRLVVIHDPLMSFAGHEAAEIENAESYRFECIASFEELPYFWPYYSSSFDIKPKQEVLDVINARFDGSFPKEFMEFLSKQDFDFRNVSGTFFNACRAFEGEFLDLLAQIPHYRNQKIFAVGPGNPTAVRRDGGGVHECLEWLDKQPPESVVYVSFGSSSTFSDEQIKQLALGLKSSGQRFLWVLRDADRGDMSVDDGEKSRQRELPPGFEEEMEGVGMVVRGWAPQLDILAHPSTGAFMSHCGWNSCMESLSMGVPIIGWHLHTDQPRNEMVVTNYLKVGIAVRDWARHDEVVLGGQIEEVIRRMMVYDEGKEIRKRAKSLGEEARLAVSEGGSSKADLNSFIAHICR